MDAVGYGPYRNILLRPAGKQRLENKFAYFSMELAYAVDLATAAERKISHIKGLRSVFRILPSHGERWRSIWQRIEGEVI